jgi:hypothetical protein
MYHVVHVLFTLFFLATGRASSAEPFVTLTCFSSLMKSERSHPIDFKKEGMSHDYPPTFPDSKPGVLDLSYDETYHFVVS